MEEGLRLVTHPRSTRRDAVARSMVGALGNGWSARRLVGKRYRALQCWCYRRGVWGFVVDRAPAMDAVLEYFDHISGSVIDRILGRSHCELGNAVLAFDALDDVYEDLMVAQDKSEPVRALGQKITAYLYCGDAERDMLAEVGTGSLDPGELLTCWMVAAQGALATAKYARTLLADAA